MFRALRWRTAAVAVFSSSQTKETSAGLVFSVAQTKIALVRAVFSDSPMEKASARKNTQAVDMLSGTLTKRGGRGCVWKRPSEDHFGRGRVFEHPDEEIHLQGEGGGVCVGRGL